jgi:GMP reductase
MRLFVHYKLSKNHFNFFPISNKSNIQINLKMIKQKEEETKMAFDYEHINLVPKLCVVGSRSECDTSLTFGKYKFKMPVVPANMECVINEELAEKLAVNNYFYILHRFLTDEQIIEFCKKMKDKSLYTSISVGVNEPSYKLLTQLHSFNLIPDYITIDIAHGHSIKMQAMIKFIYHLFGAQRPFIIAGNISTPDAVKDLESWGADACKAGIGPGMACTTYPATGFGSRGIQAFMIQECAKVATKPIIADGGIRVPGDIAKSIVLGASMCMVGGMFSSLKDSPGNVVMGTDGRMYKEFWGSASEHQSGKSNRIEGTKKLNLMQDKTLLEEMKYLEECLQSSISYGGGKVIDHLKTVSIIQHI